MGKPDVNDQNLDPIPAPIKDIDAFLAALEEGGKARDQAEREGKLEEFLRETEEQIRAAAGKKDKKE